MAKAAADNDTRIHRPNFEKFTLCSAIGPSTHPNTVPPPPTHDNAIINEDRIRVWLAFSIKYVICFNLITLLRLVPDERRAYRRRIVGKPPPQKYKIILFVIFILADFHVDAAAVFFSLFL